MIKKTNLSDYNPSSIPDGMTYKVAIVVSEWNLEITNALFQGAYETLIKHGVSKDNITVEYVPGSFELTLGAQLIANTKKVDAIICLGCVIQGETRHFDFICDAVANGITNVSIENKLPIIFGLLTTNDLQQAKERSGGKHGNKGIEAGITALKMITMAKRLRAESTL